ncbi:hypothetical protein JOQ06_014318 [Pogonophryne albipinna]|uniref:Uncharacterized protein n=1 Tax=Pogonophryne albipinna TaxID=1090488 RepID=A0AAD6AAZ2_9TELE|nr:hypothetical protein JOQ06_014318 [Pogonophryne albipinna]
MAGPAVGVLSVGARGFRRRGGHENFHPPVLGGGSPPCLPSSERGSSLAPFQQVASTSVLLRDLQPCRGREEVEEGGGGHCPAAVHSGLK